MGVEDQERVIDLDILRPSSLLPSLLHHISTPSARDRWEPFAKQQKSAAFAAHPLETVRDIVEAQTKRLKEDDVASISAQLHISGGALTGITAKGKYHPLPSIQNFEKAMKGVKASWGQKLPMLKQVHLGESRPVQAPHRLENDMANLQSELATQNDLPNLEKEEYGRFIGQAIMAVAGAIITVGLIVVAAGMFKENDMVWGVGAVMCLIGVLLLMVDFTIFGIIYITVANGKPLPCEKKATPEPTPEPQETDSTGVRASFQMTAGEEAPAEP